jgi:hypothetical protein
MTSHIFFRYARAANIIDRYHRTTSDMERNDNISIINRQHQPQRQQQQQQQQQQHGGRRYIDGAIMISTLYYNETQLKAFLPQSIEQIVSTKIKLWKSLIQSKIELEQKQSSIAVEQVPKNDSAKRKNQSKQVRECERDRSNLLAVLRGVHKEVMIHANLINHDTYRGFNNNFCNNSSSSSSSRSSSNSNSNSNSVVKHLHVIDQFIHPCIDSFTSTKETSIMFAIIFCDIINSMSNLGIEATYMNSLSSKIPPLLRLRTKWSIPYPPLPPYEKGIKQPTGLKDRSDHDDIDNTTTSTGATVVVTDDDDDDDISKDLYSSESDDIFKANRITEVFDTIGDCDDNQLISADNERNDRNKDSNKNRYNDRDKKNGERTDDTYDVKDNAEIDWSRSSNNSPKQAVIETMSHSICNKGKGKIMTMTTPLFLPSMNPSTTTSINSSNNSSNSSSRGRSSSSSSSSSNSNIDMDSVPRLVKPQHLTGRWVACDENDDDYRFQEVMVSFGRNGSLEAYKLDRNGFIEANRISWKINFNGDNNNKTVAKKIRVGESYKAEVQIALPRNMEPEFIAYNFKLHALPMSTFLSKSESLQLHHHHQEQQYAGVPRHSSLSSSLFSSTYYEIELVARHINPNKRASHTCQKMSFCRTIDMDRCLYHITHRGVHAITPVQYMKEINRYCMLLMVVMMIGGL